jgi:hypothetical protein
LLPICLAAVISLFASDYGNGSTRVVGVDPDRAAAFARKVQLLVAYVTSLSPFAMAAAWRTFVHARRWFERGTRGAQGVLEAAACGFIGALLVLLPGILTRPGQAPPYVLVYGGLAAALGLGVGAILWCAATAVLRLYPGPA